jgi:serine/threonine protein kinase
LQQSTAFPTVRNINSFLDIVPFPNTQVLPPRPFGVVPLRYKKNHHDKFFIKFHGDDAPDHGDHLLSNPRSVSLPVIFNLKDREYTVTEFVAQGSDGAIYGGSYQDGDETKEVIFKVYSGGAFYNAPGYPTNQYFKNEKNVLAKLGRLIDQDERNMILVMPKIPGISLNELVRNIRANMSKDDEETQKILRGLLEKYLNLPGEFRKKWGMAHMDIHPVNVIVDNDGEMHLIDFAKTEEIKEGEQEYRLISNMDDLYAKIAGSMHFNIPAAEFDWQ